MKVYKPISLILIFITGVLSFSFGQAAGSIDQVLDQKFEAEELFSDLDFIKTRILEKKYNRTPFLFMSKEMFNAEYDSIKTIISEKGGMSRKDFYLLISPFLNKVMDDHLSISLFGLWGIENRNAKVFDEKIIWPATAIVFNGEVFVTCSDEIPERSQLVSINDIPVLDIFNTLMKYLDYPQRRYYERHKLMSVDFVGLSLLMYSLWEFKESIEIKYHSPGSEQEETIRIPLQKFYDAKAVKVCQNRRKTAPYFLNFDQNTAILRLNTFNFNDFNKTIDLYNYLFDSIRTRKTNNLVLDISENGGGSDINWIILLKYLSSGPIKFNCNKDAVTVSEVLGYIKEVDQTKIDTTTFYDGKICLITGAETFSSAVRFADVMQANKLCKVYGQETKGKASHYGEMRKYYLPNTKLQINVSSNLFLSLDCSKERSGVLPDETISINDIDAYFDNSNNEQTVRKVLLLID